MEEHKVNYFQGLVQTGKAKGFKTCAHSQEKLRANIASEHVDSTHVTGTTAATFSSFEKVSQ